MSFFDIGPQDIDPETGMPYSNYSSPSLDTSFHDHEMAVDLTPKEELLATLKEVRAEIRRINEAAGETRFNPAATEMVDGEIAKLEGRGS